jgi:hypothetical protein
MEQNLYSKLDDLTSTLHDNHTEVVQRLTALETQLKGLPERVSSLETDKAARVGAWHVLTLVANFVITLAGFLYRKHA